MSTNGGVSDDESGQFSLNQQPKPPKPLKGEKGCIMKSHSN
jgi:hypothetical protein